VKSIYSFRQLFIKFLCCPVHFIPYWVPLLGGRTYLEWIIYAAVAIGFIATAINSKSSSEGGDSSGGSGNGEQGEESGSTSGVIASAVGLYFVVD
jgi:hypothetical protein